MPRRAASELAFQRLLTRAALAPDVVESGLVAKKVYWRYRDRPGYTYHHLTVRAGIDLVSAIQLLRDPRQAYSAELLLRSLLEYLATIGWIHTGVGSAPADGTHGVACRAIRYELHMLSEIRRSLTVRLAASPVITKAYRDRQVRALDRNMKTLRNAASKMTCYSRLAAPPDVTSLLTRLQSHPALSGSLALWVAASGVGHHHLPYRIHETTSPGVSMIGGPSTLGFRLHLLSSLLMAYGNAAFWVLEDLRSDTQKLTEELTFLEHRTSEFAAAVVGGPQRDG